MKQKREIVTIAWCGYLLLVLGACLSQGRERAAKVLIQVESPSDPRPLVIIEHCGDSARIYPCNAHEGSMMVRICDGSKTLLLAGDPVMSGKIDGRYPGEQLIIDLTDSSMSSVLGEFSDDLVVSVASDAIALGYDSLYEALLAELMRRCQLGRPLCITSAAIGRSNCELDMSTAIARASVRGLPTPLVGSMSVDTIQGVVSMELRVKNRSDGNIPIVCRGGNRSRPRVAIIDVAGKSVFDNAASGEHRRGGASVELQLVPGQESVVWSDLLPQLLEPGEYRALWWYNDRFPAFARATLDNIVTISGEVSFSVSL